MSAVARLKVSINGAEPVAGEVAVETEVIDVTCAAGETKPDLSWTYVDKAGHFHAFDHAGELPTLIVRRYKRKPTVYRCLACEKKVTPKWTTSYGRRSIPGRQDWTITVFAEVPQGPFSVRLDAGAGKEYFGFAQMHSQTAEGGAGATRVTSICGGYAVSWRKTAGAS